MNEQSMLTVTTLPIHDVRESGGRHMALRAREFRSAVPLLIASAILFLPLPGQEQPPAAAPAQATDKQESTLGGATFTAPAGWTISKTSALVVLQPPEPDLHIVFFDKSAPDAKSAVAAAWDTYRPGFKRPLKLTRSIPAREGWSERQIFLYETSPNERLEVQASAYRAGDRWTVALFEGSDQTAEKRGAPAGLILESLRPKGYERESFAHRKPHSLDAERIAQMKRFVQDAMEKLGVPGASMALIEGGKVVFEGGFGVRELGKPTPVDANTLFMAASNTKGMTTLLLSRLVDEKKLRWDEPVTEAYPAFKLGDPATTKQVLIKHLVCACTGLPRQDLEWIFEFKNATPASSLALLGTMQPTSHFGEVFQYSNLMAAAAGYIGAHIYDPNLELGAAYDEAMQKMIFTPLGMNSTTFSMATALKGNHAEPHSDNIDGKPSIASDDFNYAVMPHRPAGGVWTSSHDLSQYVQLEMNKGKLPDGTRMVSEENILIRRKPQISTGEDQFYGMGLELDETWRVPVVHHGGSMLGFKSDWVLLPDQGIGAVLLTNSDTGGMMLHPFMRRLLEVVFDGKPEAVEDLASRAATYQAYRAKERERLTVPPDPGEVAKLAPHYVSSALGDITVRHDGDGVIFDFGEWKSHLATRKNDDGTLSFVSSDPGVLGFAFVVGERDGKRALIVRDGQHEYFFTEAQT